MHIARIRLAPVPGGPPGGGGKHPWPSHPPGASVPAPAVGHGGGGGMGGHRGACGVSPKHRGGGEASWTLPLPPAQRRAPPALLSLLYPLAPREGCPRPCCHSCCHWLRGRGAHSLLPPPQPLAPVVRRRRLRRSLRSRRHRGESAHCRCRSCSRRYPLASHPAVIDRRVHTEQKGQGC
jgi:hypothetical protein